MSELLESFEVRRIQTQFAQLGHVGIAGVYTAELAVDAAGELPLLYPTPYNPVTANVATSSRGSLELDSLRPKLKKLVEATTAQANNLKSTELCWSPGSRYFLQTIGMGPNVEGIRHRDALGHPGAISVGNFRGSSRLLIEDGSEYLLHPGDVAYLDPMRKLVHQGIAGSEGRHGVVIAIMTPYKGAIK